MPCIWCRCAWNTPCIKQHPEQSWEGEKPRSYCPDNGFCVAGMGTHPSWALHGVLRAPSSSLSAGAGQEWICCSAYQYLPSFWLISKGQMCALVPFAVAHSCNFNFVTGELPPASPWAGWDSPAWVEMVFLGEEPLQLLQVQRNCQHSLDL